MKDVTPQENRDVEDLALLRALAAAQSHFGNQEAAVKIVELAEWLSSDDVLTIELRALIEMRRGRIEDAYAAVVRLRHLDHEISDVLGFVERRMQAAGA